MDRKTRRTEAVGNKEISAKTVQSRCRNRLASLISEGLNPLPECVFSLGVLLTEPVVDLKKLTRTLGPEFGLQQRVLRLANLGLTHPNDAILDLSDAAVLLGPSLFHAAVLIAAVTDFGPQEFRDANAEALWFHSILMANVSERIAELSEYPVRGTAYVAGLLHDIGHLPMLIVAREQGSAYKDLASGDWQDNLDLERQYFGLDHCEIGRWMGKLWRFSEPLIDAVQYHHDSSMAKVDSHLAEIVSAAEHFCSGAFCSSSQADTAEFMGLGEPPCDAGRRLKEHSHRPMVWGWHAYSENRSGTRFQN